MVANRFSREAQLMRVEFVGIMPTLFAHCQHCKEAMHGGGLQPYSEQLEEYPEKIRRQYFELSEMAQRDEFERAVFDNIRDREHRFCERVDPDF